VGPGFAEQREETLHRVRGIARVIPAPAHSRDRQRQAALGGTFPKECCFQVIYFVLNISFLALD
jgi:hypothetical protein